MKSIDMYHEVIDRANRLDDHIASSKLRGSEQASQEYSYQETEAPLMDSKNAIITDGMVANFRMVGNEWKKESLKLEKVQSATEKAVWDCAPRLY